MDFQNRTHDICVECSKDDKKYTCPVCQRNICSLSCSVNHKQKCVKPDTPLKFVPKKNFDAKILEQDYQFLSELGSQIEEIARFEYKLSQLEQGSKMISASDLFQKKLHTRKGFTNKQLEVILAANIILIKAPTLSSLHCRNKTQITTGKNQAISWYCEIQYQNKTYCNFFVKSSTTFQQLFDHLKNAEFIYSADPEDYFVLIKDQNNPNSTNSYFFLDTTVEIQNALYGLVIKEFPVFQLIEKNDVDTSNTKCRCIMPTIHKNVDFCENIRGNCIGFWKSNCLHRKLQLTDYSYIADLLYYIEEQEKEPDESLEEYTRNEFFEAQNNNFIKSESVKNEQFLIKLEQLNQPEPEPT